MDLTMLAAFPHGFKYSLMETSKHLFIIITVGRATITGLEEALPKKWCAVPITFIFASLILPKSGKIRPGLFYEARENRIKQNRPALVCTERLYNSLESD
jgi:hypothetical protein